MVEKMKLYFEETPGEMFSISSDKQCGHLQTARLDISISR